eukprot:TRINITY_DN2849_c1_g3_i4.p1 TRINITY_DN2849_c1_g3~~TRINITY_DN2849_c1_g3_i4.p1  ORF type:complete len:696 (-),score=204.75 TRINITY_DN2849_c1_g3_i4:12-1883(-)
MEVQGDFLSEFFNPGFSATPRFTGNQLYDVTAKVNLAEVNGSVGCFGDFDSDKYTDIFVISNARDRVQVWLWSVKTFTYEPLANGIVNHANISNIAAGDFDYDGRMDLLVTGSNATGTFMEIYLGNYDSFRGSRVIKLDGKLSGDVLVLDANGDRKLDMYGSYQNGTRFFLINKGDADFSIQKQEGHPNRDFTVPNANAIVDMNGNCLADLVVTSVDGNSQFLEIWDWQSSGFKLQKEIPLSSGSQIPTFSDIDADGTMDVIIPICFPSGNCSETNSIEILYNVQMSMCSGIFEASSCRNSQELCTMDPNFQLESGNLTVGSGNRVIIPTEAFGNSKFYFDPTHAITLRIGDFNLDGFPDLIFPVEVEGVVTSQLWVNEACTLQYCTQQAIDSGRRYFTRVGEGVDDLTAIKNPYATTFIDLDENGILDVLVLGNSTENSTNSQTIHAIYNNFFNDAFFLKTMGLNGVWSDFQNPKPYGVNYPGATWKYTMTELNGDKKAVMGVQLRQSGNLALQTPYILFGLGRTSNYIEEIYMGISPNFHMWVQAIPNSQVVGIPTPADDPTSWTLELYIRTLGLALWAGVAVASWLVVTGILIYVFRWREKRQDQALKQEKAHLVNFDAL